MSADSGEDGKARGETPTGIYDAVQQAASIVQSKRGWEEGRGHLQQRRVATTWRALTGIDLY